jgi:hypothetical protein
LIHELVGTEEDALRLLACHTLDPRDETLFIEHRWTQEEGSVWELQGRFLDTDSRFHLRHAGSRQGIQHLSEAIGANLRSAAYQAAWRGLVPHLERWLAIGRANPWIREADDPPFTERSFSLCRTAEQVANMVDRNNWTKGTGFVWVEPNICMIQQEEGPGEFLVIRNDVKFDSWTTGHPYIHGAKLIAYLNAVAAAPLDERGVPQWEELVEWDEDDGSGVVVAASATELLRLLAA